MSQIETVVELPAEASAGELIDIVVTIYNTTTIPEPHNIDWALPSIKVDGKAVFTGDQRHIPPIEYDEINYEIWYYQHVMPAKTITVTVDSYFESGYYPFHKENTVTKIVQLTGGTPSGDANLSGEVTDSSNGDPLAGVAVTLDGKSAMTGQDGAYSITDFAPGTYTIIFAREGYQLQVLNLNLVEGNNEVDIQLNPTSEPPQEENGGGLGATPILLLGFGTVFMGIILASKIKQNR